MTDKPNVCQFVQGIITKNVSCQPLKSVKKSHFSHAVTGEIQDRRTDKVNYKVNSLAVKKIINLHLQNF